MPYIEGDGIGSDISPVMKTVVDYAVKEAYNDREIEWQEIFAGQKAFDKMGEWLPESTLEAIQTHGVAIKGPLTTPIGGGIRSLNVALRQKLGLFCCQRPVQYFQGVPSPMKHPEKLDVVVFRENSEDIYSGIEFEAGTDDAKRLLNTLKNEFSVNNIPYPDSTGIGVKLISKEASQRLVIAAIEYAISQKRDNVAIVHKGNIMKYTEGAFMQWAYDVVRERFGGKALDYGYEIIHEGHQIKVTDIIADACFQHVLLKPDNFDVIATMNLNGDYLSDALAAQVGGIGIAPGANLSDDCALFEATHGTAPSYAGKNLANPSSLILSAEMMLRHIGWQEAADKVLEGIRGAIANQEVTQDFTRHMKDVKPLTTSEFGEAICRHMTR